MPRPSVTRCCLGGPAVGAGAEVSRGGRGGPRPGRSWLLEGFAGELGSSLEECVASGMLTRRPAHVSFRHELARARRSRRRCRRTAGLRSIAPRSPRSSRAARRTGSRAPCASRAGADDFEAVFRWAPQAAARAGSSGPITRRWRITRAHSGSPPPCRSSGALSCSKVVPVSAFLTDQFDDAIVAQREALECHKQSGDRLGEGDALRSPFAGCWRMPILTPTSL